MARKDSSDRPLLERVRTQFETTDAATLLRAPSDDLLSYIRKVPLIYGFWGDFKGLFKAAEKSTAVEPIAALLARLDTADLPRHSPRLPELPFDSIVNAPGRMVFVGSLLYIVSQDWRRPGVHIVDMTLPAAPIALAHVRIQNAIGLAVSGNRMFVLQSDAWNAKGRLSSYDIADPRHPKPEGGVEIAGGSALAVEGSLVGVIVPQGRRPGLQVIDASLPGQLRLMAHVSLSPVAIQIVDRTAYLIERMGRNGQDRLLVLDLADPLNPRQKKEIPIPTADDLEVQGRYAYLACSLARNPRGDALAGLAVVDLNPTGLSFLAGPRQIAALPLGQGMRIAIQGRYAYLSVAPVNQRDPQAGGLRIVDIADPAHPQLVGSLPANNAGSIAISGNTLCQNFQFGWHSQLHAMHIGEPTRPFLLGVSPSRETIGYMKRRGRRLLRDLALRAPEAFVRAATRTLIESAEMQPALDRRLQWISMDLLYGGGNRYEQQSHGRGGYGAPRPGLSFKTREERYSELWDRYPEMALLLYTTQKLPPETREMACRILLSTGTPLPALNEKMLAEFLQAASPLLQSVALRQVVSTLEEGRNVAADLVAESYFRGTRRQRAVFDSFVARQSGNARWITAFATRLYQLASGAIRGAHLSRKATRAFTLLIRQSPALFQRDVRPETVIALYNTGRSDFARWATEVLQNLQPAQLTDWLATIEALPPAMREAAMNAILSGIQTREISKRAVETLVNHASEWVRQAGWRILAQMRTALAPVAAVWSDLLNSQEPTPALLTAFASEDALALFSRCDFDSRTMASRLDAHPFLIPLLPTAALVKVVAVLPPSTVLGLISEASEAQWPGLQTAVLLGPLQPESRAAFWREAFSAIGATGNATLIARLLNNPQMQTAFRDLDDITEYLRSANPVFGPLLGLWIRTHIHQLLRDSAELLQIGTHPLPDIRNAGLERIRQVGMSLPFALRLLESELPPAVQLGRTFFEQVAEDRQAEAITALCDSPKPSVRQYGRAVLAGRPALLTDPEILARLAENPDTETQAFVARELLTQPAPPERVQSFDRSVLRARDKGRRAKELVKKRMDAQPTPDIALLLEMARSRTPRDAEWALSQLAKLALEGVEIPGFTLDGVAGV